MRDRIAAAGALWAFRATAELDAAARFQRIEGELRRLHASAALADLAAKAAVDERRHHVLCAELAQRFGRREVASVERRAGPLDAGLHDPRQQLLYEVVAMSCITESLSAALLLQMRKDAEDDAVARVVHAVLRDEVSHAQLGWGHLAAESSRIHTAFLGPCLPRMLAATVDEEIFGEGTAPGDDLAAWGGLPRATRCEIFVGTMRDVVFPGLRRFGVDTAAGEQWMRSRQRTRAQDLGQLAEHRVERR
jgi:hypothetical protein